MVTLVQQYFSEAAKRFPQKRAVSCADEETSFSDLENFTNGAARQLSESGLERGSFVPFFMKKGVNSIRSILTILKADCAYVPVDVKSPGHRVQSIFAACSAPLVLVDRESKPLLEAIIDNKKCPQLIVIDDFLSDTNTQYATPAYQNLSIDIAYVLFTSGSTGVPKGVMIPHKAIIDYIDWCVDEYDLGADDVIANHAPLYFDNSTFDLYTAFKTGAELHLVDDAVNDFIPALIKWIDKRQISTFFCVPSVLSMLLRSRRMKDDSFASLRHLICAGEVLPPDVLRQWMERYPHIQYTNMYGPTEITVDCTFHVFDEAPAADATAVPIGKARPNMELFVRDEDGALLQKPGSRGELLVRGTSVAYGYLGDEDKTGKVFVQNPENSLFPDPLYCTGDLVEIAADGNFFFLGRADDQIKYLGYRIELGEVEAALASVDKVDEAVVVFKNGDDAAEQAIGALVGSSTGIDANELRDALKDKLPAYMVPTVIVFEDSEFPRTANGKYDRKAVLAQVFA